MKKSDQEKIRSLFQPTFGNRPEQYIGRDGVIEQFMAGLREPVGSRNRCTLFLGQRGMGKTALLLELGDRARVREHLFSSTRFVLPLLCVRWLPRIRNWLATVKT